MQEYTWLLPIIFFVVGGCIILFITRKSGDNKAVNEAPKEIELTERFCMGGYLGGIPNSPTQAPLVFCAVTEGSFIFMRGKKGVEIGRIPRDAVDNIIVGEKSQVAQHLTDQEKLYLGKISASKKDERHCLVLSWENSSGPKHNSVFEFYEESPADKTAQELKKWMKQKQVA